MQSVIFLFRKSCFNQLNIILDHKSYSNLNRFFDNYEKCKCKVFVFNFIEKKNHFTCSYSLKGGKR